MPDPKTLCVSDDRLHEFVEERLDVGAESDVQAHIDGCADCRSRLERITASGAEWARLRDDVDLVAPAVESTDAADRDVRQLLGFLGPTDDPTKLGRLGHYEVVGFVGKGSAGIVLKAYEPQLGRHVAAKVLSPSFASNGPARARFQREARAIAAVSHEHVVPVYAVDEHDGLPFLVMQYASGGSLQQRIERDGPLDTCAVLRLGIQIARGLAAAHAQGIVHRDVKPANVMLEGDVDRAMVTDFGLARVADEAALTRSGVVAGTPQYMSPEQARGEPVDPRSDLFSLGSVLYTACTGHSPFRAGSVFGVIKRVCEDEPRPIRELVPEVEPWLAEFIERLLEKRADDRFASTNEVADLLAAELAHAQNPTVVPSPDRSWRRPVETETSDRRPRVVAIGAAFAAAAVAILFALGSGLGERDDAGDGALDGASRAGIWSPASFDVVDGAPLAAVADQDDEPEAEPADVPVATPPPSEPLFDVRSEAAFELVTGGTFTFRSSFESVEVHALKEGPARAVVSRLASAKDADVAREIADKHSVYIEKDAKNQLELVCALDDGTQAGGDFTLRAVSVEVWLPAGTDVDVRTDSGSVSIADATGATELRTKSGSIDALLGTSALFAASTSGDVCARLSNGDRGTCRLESVQGNVQLTMESDDVVQVDARSETGNVRGPNGSVVTSGRMRITQGEGAKKIVLRSDSGNVTVRYAMSEPLEPDEAPEPTEAPEPDEWPMPTDRPAADERPEPVEAPEPVEEPEPADRPEPDEVVVEEPEPADLPEAGDAADPEGECDSVDECDESEAECADEACADEDCADECCADEDCDDKDCEGEDCADEVEIDESCAEADAADAPRATGSPCQVVRREADGSVLDGYVLYLPTNYASTETKYPVVVSLAGGCYVGGRIDGVANSGMLGVIDDRIDGGANLDRDLDRMLLDTFVVIGPHLRGGSFEERQYWLAADEIGAILDEVGASHRIDASRVYVAGAGRGGHGAWGLASRMPERFAAAVPIRGRIDGVTSFEALATMPLWVAHLEDDDEVDVLHSLKAIERIEPFGDKPFVKLARRLPEDGSYLEAGRLFSTGEGTGWIDLFRNTELYWWMLRQRRPAAEAAPRADAPPQPAEERFR